MLCLKYSILQETMPALFVMWLKLCPSVNSWYIEMLLSWRIYRNSTVSIWLLATWLGTVAYGYSRCNVVLWSVICWTVAIVSIACMQVIYIHFCGYERSSLCCKHGCHHKSQNDNYLWSYTGLNVTDIQWALVASVKFLVGLVVHHIH